jgi:hypothetical protein
MARRGDSAKLRRILSIRGVQLVAAEARAAQAAEGLRKSTATMAEREKARQDIEKQWFSIFSAPSIPAELLPSLRTAYSREEDALCSATRAVEHATTELTLRKNHLHEATAHLDVAKQMVRRAVRHEQKKREEIAALDTSDRDAQMAGRP